MYRSSVQPHSLKGNINDSNLNELFDRQLEIEKELNQFGLTLPSLEIHLFVDGSEGKYIISGQFF